MNEIYQEASVYLPFKTIRNCRDLAGMKTRSNKAVKPGLLLRSAHLGHADEQDLLTLYNLGIRDVIDFRTDGEVLMSPDRPVPGGLHFHDPVYREKDLKNEAGGQIKFLEETVMDSRKVLIDGYIGAIRNADSIEAWKTFFDILLKAEGGVLFHCTQGKDRTGIAAMLIETALDVEPSLILDDYMQTNLYTENEAAEDRLMAARVLGHHTRLAREDIDTFLLAHEDCFQAVNTTILEGWGSWKNYLREAIGLSEEDLHTLQNKYLEDVQP